MERYGPCSLAIHKGGPCSGDIKMTDLLFYLNSVSVHFKDFFFFFYRCCRRRLYDWLKIAPYESRVSDEDDEEWDTANGKCS